MKIVHNRRRLTFKIGWATQPCNRKRWQHHHTSSHFFLYSLRAGSRTAGGTGASSSVFTRFWPLSVILSLPLRDLSRRMRTLCGVTQLYTLQLQVRVYFQCLTAIAQTFRLCSIDSGQEQDTLKVLLRLFYPERITDFTLTGRVLCSHYYNYYMDHQQPGLGQQERYWSCNAEHYRPNGSFDRYAFVSRKRWPILRERDGSLRRIHDGCVCIESPVKVHLAHEEQRLRRRV